MTSNSICRLKLRLRSVLSDRIASPESVVSGSLRRLRRRAVPGGPARLPFPVLFLFCLCLSFALPSPASAALKARQSSLSAAEASNPRPDEMDILLPMPCNGQMAFKAVGTQADGFLWDMQTQFGCDQCDRQENDYYERRYATAVSGPFSPGDLPESWRGALPKAESGSYYFYLIGKYEISRFQWQAVMEGQCPRDLAALPPEAARPMTGISWPEAMRFAEQYTAWLLENAPESLPRFVGDDKNVGYLRLPTEAEWEYAARGGHAVPRASLRELEFFVMEDGASHADYAVFRAESGRAAEELAPIGSRLPNPLGIYDSAGNAAEMTLDVFHFSLGGRLHGSAGGFVRKGGSFVSSLNEILPGRREEAALFIADGPNATRDMGARLVLSGINTPSGRRPDILAEEWRKAGEGQGLLLDQGKNPLEELDRLIAATGSPQEKENLSRLRGVLKDNNIALERQNRAAAGELVRSSLFMVETVRNYGVRHKSFVNMIDGNREELAAARKKGISREGLAEIENTLEMLEKSRLDMAKALDAAVSYYRSKVEDSLNYPQPLFDAELAVLGADFKGEDRLAKSMREAHATYARHVALLRGGERSRLSRDYLIRDILPKNLLDQLLQ